MFDRNKIFCVIMHFLLQLLMTHMLLTGPLPCAS